MNQNEKIKHNNPLVHYSIVNRFLTVRVDDRTSEVPINASSTEIIFYN